MHVSLRQTIRCSAFAAMAGALLAASHGAAFAQPAGVREGRALIRQQQHVKALERLQEAVKADPTAVEALAAKAWLHATTADPKVRNPKQAVADAATAVQLGNYQQRRARANTQGVTNYTKEQRLENLYVAALAYGAAGNYTQAMGHAQYAMEAARRLNQTSPSQQSKELLAASEAAMKRIMETDKTAATNALQRIEQACMVTGQDDVMGRGVEFAGVAPLPEIKSRM